MNGAELRATSVSVLMVRDGSDHEVWDPSSGTIEVGKVSSYRFMGYSSVATVTDRHQWKDIDLWTSGEYCMAFALNQ